MERCPCEMFAHFYYSPIISYEELHHKEAELVQRVDLLLSGEGAIHLEFVPGSDNLAVQGEFGEFDRSLFDRLAERVSGLLPMQTESRMVFVEKENLEKILIYNIAPKQVDCGETIIKRPFAGEEQ